jgi:hypothetical protein
MCNPNDRHEEQIGKKNAHMLLALCPTRRQSITDGEKEYSAQPEQHQGVAVKSVHRRVLLGESWYSFRVMVQTSPKPRASRFA